MQAIVKLDHWLAGLLLRFRNPFATKFLLIITVTGKSVSWFVAAAVLNVFPSLIPSPRLFLHGLFAPLTAWIIATLMKLAFPRKRPSIKLPEYEALVIEPGLMSFPSSHAAASMAFASYLLLAGHPLEWPVLGWALLVTFSRLYLGAHFLSDVVAGSALGCVCALLLKISL